ncbi:hypothetical protein [Sutcliffiella horikoshii]|uniref:Uncharacterized protein n=1 Tax=Sutcliffiella horikoshii TaxID=79883 RepID=A0A5D4TG36_9BACI|nr:hypothetical protein [Sutcliffiella horikoshii]TYS73492.1 hypothetical protein FZC75_03930 [Sutcliffiella horikoshii]
MQYKEKQAVKERLDHEIKDFHFTGCEKVIQKTHPKSFAQKLSSFWNKEIELPVLPMVVTATLIFSTISLKDDLNSEVTTTQAEREIIQIAGYTYWKDDYERAVKEHENKGEN